VDEHDDTLAVQRVAARLDDLIARPAAVAAQARRDAERWLDDGGSLGPEAMAEAYERAHEARSVVLDKLRYMRGGEPLPGYDALTTEQIAEALAGADAGTVKAVRDYERKFQHRQSVLDETARVLPDSQASAAGERAHEEKATLLREGYADRERTAPDPPG
jgi:hypothetical protein